MFKEPLENPADPTNLASQLTALCDAYYEFHCFCAFVQHANSLIANEPMEIDETIAEGFGSVAGHYGSALRRLRRS